MNGALNLPPAVQGEEALEQTAPAPANKLAQVLLTLLTERTPANAAPVPKGVK